MPDEGCARAFDDPIPLPNGGELRTLRDAGNFIAKVPKREHDAFARRSDLSDDLAEAGTRKSATLSRSGRRSLNKA